MSNNKGIPEKAKRLPELIDYYEVCNRAEGKSPRTVSWYSENLKRFNHYLITRRAEFHGLCPWVNEKAAI